ncbi:uncharacterized protein [Euphorbia lathyris]|uniref:uncharacterized protein isoform X2 n=1 Tax=Euphorbia lathyris TaxID=212925 RepID=UPI003313FDFE
MLMEKRSKAKQSMKRSEMSTAQTITASQRPVNKPQKPFFRPAIDDSKPSLQDPILRSDPMETEEAVLRLPHFPVIRLNHPSQTGRGSWRNWIGPNIRVKRSRIEPNY